MERALRKHGALPAPKAGNPLVSSRKGVIPGWFHFRHFYDMVAAEAPQGARVVEIGNYCGASLIYLAEKRTDLEIIGVDWGRGDPYFQKKKTTDALLTYLEEHNLTDRVPLLVWDSSKAAKFIADNSCWLVFIDGDHSEAGLTKDINAWLPKVQKGGIIGGDDYTYGSWPDVKKVVDKIFPNAEKMSPYTWWWEV